LNKILLLLALAGLLYACGDGYAYQKRLAVNPQAWTYADTLDFRFTITDTTARYNLYVDVTHADTFAWQNLYTRLYTRFPDGRRLNKPLSFDLYTSRGESNGKCSGNTCRVETVLQANTRFDQAGEYVITVAQFMRQDSLRGIVEVGLAVEKKK
jgi:gliding motility-associated lipoprotein GldH